MTAKRFERVHEYRYGQIGIKDNLKTDGADSMFPQNLDENETVELLNALHEENIRLSDKNRQLTKDLTQAHCDIAHLMRGENIENKND